MFFEICLILIKMKFVPCRMSKIDIKQYLEKLYNVEVLNVRTENREKDVMAMPIRMYKFEFSYSI